MRTESDTVSVWALTEDEVVEDLDALLHWAEERQLRISPDFDRAYADQMDGLLGLMIDEGIVTRYDEGPEIVYGIALEQHPVASYYRNTTIHFFVNKAIIELALLKAAEADRDRADAVEERLVAAGADLYAENCASCHTCQVRCPRGIEVPKVFEAVRLLTLRQNEDFIKLRELADETIEGAPQIAMVSAFRKLTA